MNIKFNRIIGIIALSIVSMVAISARQRSLPSTYAEPLSGSSFDYTDDLGIKISNQCESIKLKLTENLRLEDLAARRNRVRSYEDTFRRLDALANSYTLNGVDNSNIVKQTTSFRQQKDLFVDQFENYYQSLSNLIKLDCRNSPEAFYSKLSALRIERSGLNTQLQNFDKSLQTFLEIESSIWN